MMLNRAYTETVASGLFWCLQVNSTFHQTGTRFFPSWKSFLFLYYANIYFNRTAHFKLDIVINYDRSDRRFNTGRPSYLCVLTCTGVMGCLENEELENEDLENANLENDPKHHEITQDYTKGK